MKLICVVIRVSATNNGRIYDLEHQDSRRHFPSDWSINPTLTSTLVWDAFFLFALLLDRIELGMSLVLSNQGDQTSRLDPALRERNQSMAGVGRENWNHVCNKCCASKIEDGKYCEQLMGLYLCHYLM